MPNHQDMSSNSWSPYRREGNLVLVDIKLRSIAQLYNTFDPSPFHERDLDDAAAAYIEDAVTEIHRAEAIKLVVHVQETLDRDAVTKAAEAIHNYFAYRAHISRLRLREQLRIGRISLVVGLLFLVFCIELSHVVAAQPGTLASILREGFVIIGWVAMWKPLEIFLYSWWPLRGKRRLYEKIAAVPVEFTQRRE